MSAIFTSPYTYVFGYYANPFAPTPDKEFTGYNYKNGRAYTIYNIVAYIPLIGSFLGAYRIAIGIAEHVNNPIPNTNVGGSPIVTQGNNAKDFGRNTADVNRHIAFRARTGNRNRPIRAAHKGMIVRGAIELIGLSPLLILLDIIFTVGRHFHPPDQTIIPWNHNF